MSHNIEELAVIKFSDHDLVAEFKEDQERWEEEYRTQCRAMANKEDQNLFPPTFSPSTISSGRNSSNSPSLLGTTLQSRDI